MKYNKSKLKFKKSDNINELIRIFEENSLVIKNIIDMKLLISEIVFGIFIFCVIFYFIRNYELLKLFFVYIYFFFMVFYITYKYINSIKKNTNNIGGMTMSLHDVKNIKSNIDYNLNLMRNEDNNLMYKILKINKLYNKECIKIILEYISSSAKKRKNEIFDIIKILMSVYFIPITFGIISIYTSFNSDKNFDQEIISILYIVFKIAVIFSIIIIFIIIHKIKEFSITDNYTNKRIIKVLTNIIINMEKSKFKR